MTIRLFALIPSLALVFLVVLTPSAAQTQDSVRKAVVLGGGGTTGRAWELGILKSLHDASTDLFDADLVVGTSSGAVIGAQVRGGRSLDDLYEAIRNPSRGSTVNDPSLVDFDYVAATNRLWVGVESTPQLRIQVGQRALAATRVVSQDDHIRSWVRGLGIGEWPTRPLLIAAVDVYDGTTRLVSREDGVSIETAVAASTAIPGRVAPITIGVSRYMDGAVASSLHADAAAGFDYVVAISPGVEPVVYREIELLRSRGAQVILITPDQQSTEARGRNSLDPERVAPSAEAGVAQGNAIAADLGSFWNQTIARIPR